MEKETNLKNSFQYGRVSSQGQMTSGDSLEEQEIITKNFAIKKGINPVRFYGDAMSGRKLARVYYDLMIKDIKEANKYKQTIHFVIIKCIDRFTRAGADFYMQMKKDLEKLNVNLLDTDGIIQGEKNTLADKGFSYDWSLYHPSETQELMEAQSGKEEVRKILTRMIGAEISLTKKGFKMGSTIYGLKGKREFIDDKERVVFVKDEEKAKFVIKAFEMRASGIYSDIEIVNELNAMGYKSPIRHKWIIVNGVDRKRIGTSGGKEMNLKRLNDIIKIPTYCGLLVHKWNNNKPIKAYIEELVSIETFNKANRGKIYILENSDGTFDIKKNYSPKFGKPKIKKNKDFPYKNIIKCHLCGFNLKASNPKGRSGEKFPTYHCSLHHKYFGINKNTLEETVENYLEKISFSDSFVNKLEKELVNTYTKLSSELSNKSAKIHVSISDLKTQKESLLNQYLETGSKVIKESLEKRIEALEDQIINATEVRDENEVEEINMDEFLKYTKEFIKNPSGLILEEKEDIDLVEVLFGLIFSEKPTYEDLKNGTAKLTSVFNLKTKLENQKSDLVCLSGFEPELRVPQTLVLTITL